MSELYLESVDDSQSNEALHNVVSQLGQRSDQLTQSSDRNNLVPRVPCKSGYVVGLGIEDPVRGTCLV